MKQTNKDFRGISMPIDTYNNIDSLRLELMEKWEQEHGVKFKISIPDVVSIAVKFYVQHRDMARKLNYEKPPKGTEL